MFNKGTKLYSVLHQKCPRCQEGDMFSHPVWSPAFSRMHKNCPVCGLDFIQEPSFYFGAMYFSYAFQVVVFVLVYLVLQYTYDPGTWTYVVFMILGSILVLPLNFRMSRAAWINLFISYRVHK
ncbi:DUF983 domain-containing protein [Ohtaekwangia koreensis]|uniref:Uncharacterized conserved protein, DUF983 family n=1 Tax=Ohtaekwangia koreensis TaxID=688867 RepID=A0A1T5KS38_9BACT|nr:DUF983 domain-containing protein [Ohtaekwangia koreensis]SKC66594.1 Uncharacterized conserved protein, DUF983 family [Ohtaekwangia koreensis]